MKKHLLKSIFACLLVASMALTITACGNKTDAGAGAGASDAAATPLTEEEYMTKFEELGTKMTELQQSTASIDPTDVEAANKLLDDMKVPFNDFIAVVPPEKYAEAHTKFQSGCQAMVDYIDAAKSLMTETDATKQQEIGTKLMELLTTATTDLSEGAQLASAAK